MQIYQQLYQTKDPFFEAILEEASQNPALSQGQHNSIDYLNDDFPQELKDQKLSETQNIWGIIDQPLQLEIDDVSQSEVQPQQEVEISKIVASRREQESKLNEYLAKARAARQKQTASKQGNLKTRPKQPRRTGPKKTRKIDKDREHRKNKKQA